MFSFDPILPTHQIKLFVKYKIIVFLYNKIIIESKNGNRSFLVGRIFNIFY